MIVQFSRAGLKDPQLIRLDTDIKMSDELRLGFFLVRSNEKIAALLYFIRNIIPRDQQTILFTATRHHSELLHAIFNKIDVSSAMIYGNMDQDLRTSNLKSFRQGQVNYLIVTDVAARGIDVPLLNNVINFHFPPSPKLFVHRCGRAARQGRIGFAFSLVEPDELAYMTDVHRFLGKEVDTGYPMKKKKDSKAKDEVDDLDGSDEEGETQNEEVAEVDEDDEKYTYDLTSMTPQMFHTGLIPQDAIDEENEFVKQMLQDDDTLATLYRIAENGLKQYKRTRSEASHDGVRDAKKVVKSELVQTIHPLIKGCDPNRCSKEVVAKAEFIRQLQTFRPHATVFETGIGTGSLSHASSSEGRKSEKQRKSLEIMKEFRKSTQWFLERNKKKLSDAAKESEKVNDDENNNDEEDGEGQKKSDWDMLDDDFGTENDEFNNNNNDEVVDQDDGHFPDGDQSIAGESYIAPNRNQHKRLSIAERKKLKKYGKLPPALPSSDEFQEINDQSKSQRKSGSAAGFQDQKYYMNYGNESSHETFAEETLQPLSNLKSGETFGIPSSFSFFSSF
jgi:ATP-dependent RNA helicase DDX54/DBP10